MSRINEIEVRLSAIKGELELDGADLEALTQETDSLIEERKGILDAIETRKSLLDKIANDNTLPTVDRKEETINMSNFEQTRTIKLGAEETRNILSTGVAKPVGVNETINDNMNMASSIVDMVKTVSCEGMGSNMVVYVDTDATAGDRTEGVAPSNGEPTFGKVTIAPKLVGVLGYVSNEIKKQSPVQYESKVRTEFNKALKNKIAKVIVDAIYDDTSIAKRVTDIAKIDATTLRKLALNYGGDDSVEGNAVLFLTKADLVAFGDVRGTNEKKAVYEITPDTMNPNTGIIRDGGLAVRYCLCSQLNSLTGAVASASDDVCTMIYGQPQAFELDVFGASNVLADESYKFAEGLITIKGEASANGAVVVKNGFSVVTLAKTE